MIELFDELRTCEDVRSLGIRGVGEGLRMDYKEKLTVTERGTLTKIAKKELARDVSALANAEGGLLVIGVKDPEREGDPPCPEDFVGIPVADTFARDLENVLLGTISPPLYPLVKVTEDDFEEPDSGECRRFVVVGARRSSRLHQVTAGEDLRFYRRAGYQNRPMDAGEVRLRIAAETSAEAGTDELLRKETTRIDRVFEGGPRVAFVAIPTIPHRFAVEPATGDISRQLDMYLQRQPPHYAPSGVDILSPGFDGSRIFAPAGDGARSFYRMTSPNITAEVRVRRDGLISSARDFVEIYSEPHERLWLRRPQPWNEILVPVAEEERDEEQMVKALRQAAGGYPSTVVDLTPAVRIEPSIILAAARGFLLFVRETCSLLGYPGPVRIEAQVSGGDSYLVAAAPTVGAEPRFYFTSEQIELHSSVEAEQQDLVERDADLAEEILTRLAWHFGIETFRS